jgi:sugar-phosphatase
MSLSCTAVLFDLDGVLIDSDAAIEQRWRQWAEERNVPFEEVEAIYHGRPMVEVIEEVAPHLDAQRESNRMRDVMTAAPEAVRAFDGAGALLEGLPPGRWAIATSGRRRTATNRLDHVDLPVPNVFITADDVERGKPAPDAYELAAERLSVSPSDCVVFEDASYGVTAGRRAGAYVIGVATTSDAEALADADVVIPSLAAVDIELDKQGFLTIRRTEAS